MLQASNSRYGVIEVGKSVLVAIPEVDRPKAGARSLMAVVLQERDGFYKLGTPNGRLPNYFARNQVEPLEECFVLQSGVLRRRTAFLSSRNFLGFGHWRPKAQTLQLQWQM